jgi:cytochrome c553
MSIRTLTALLLILTFATGAVQAGGDASNGEALSADCAMCHGDDGMGDAGELPAIAGLDEAAIVTALKGFASGEREDKTGMMADYAGALSEQDMADLAAYYAALK